MARSQCPGCGMWIFNSKPPTDAERAVIEAARAWANVVAEEREWVATQKHLKINENLERIYLAVEALDAAERGE